jgi:hypothetical protein
VRLRNDHHCFLGLLKICLILLAYPNPIQGQEFLGPYIERWDTLNHSPLDDIRWQRPDRRLHRDGRVRIHLKGESSHFRSMTLTPVVMVADHNKAKIFRSEEARTLLVQDIPFDVTNSGKFQLAFDLQPAIYRFHLTFETLALERLSYLIILNVKREQSTFQRFVKTTHNRGVERFLTYDDILERADHEAYVQTEDIESKLEALYKARRKNYISVGLGATLMSYSQTTEELSKRVNSTQPHLPQVSLGIDYNFGRDFYVIGEIRHNFIANPETEPFELDSNKGFSWSSQFVHGHYILPFWGRRIDVIGGLHRTSLPYFNRLSRRVLEIEKDTLVTTVLGVKGRWLLSEKSEIHLQFLLRPVLFGAGEELSSQLYYGLGFMVVRNLNNNWRLVFDGGFDKYGADRILRDGFDGQDYLSRQSILQPYLLLKIGRRF